MRGQRARTKKGRLREIRDDKTVGHFEEQYGVDTGRRSDMQIGNLMKAMKVSSQDQLLKKCKKKKR